MTEAAVAATLAGMKRRAILTTHIVASVGLLGSVAALVALNVRAATTTDPALAASAYELLTMFSFVFGIPLSFISLISGVVLGLGSKWGVLRYRWVTAKLVLNLSVIVVGAFVIGPQTAAMVDDGGGSQAVLIAAGVWDVVALTLATTLSVFKPGRARDRGSRGERGRARTTATTGPPADPSRSRTPRPTPQAS
jgi:uncharacterized membrane protein